jgi:hypothetical protein
MSFEEVRHGLFGFLRKDRHKRADHNVRHRVGMLPDTSQASPRGGPELKARSLCQNGIWQPRMVAEVSREKCHKQT